MSNIYVGFISSVSQAVEAIFNVNLLMEFEEDFGEVKEGYSICKHITINNITLEQLIDFLNKYATDNYRYLLDEML